MNKKEKILIAAALAVTLIAGVLHYTHANAVHGFFITAAALAMLAMIVGNATEQLGSRMGPGQQVFYNLHWATCRNYLYAFLH